MGVWRLIIERRKPTPLRLSSKLPSLAAPPLGEG